MQHDIVLKKLNFDLLIPRVSGGGGGGSAGKKIATMLLHFEKPINLIINYHQNFLPNQFLAK